MAEEKFTPGPWRTELTRIYPPERDVIVSSWNDKTPFDEAVANAALIAAAPELYECLKTILAYCTINKHYSGPAERALAKARGEAELEEAKK